MSQFVLTMTSRMVAITVTCLVLLCILLFLLGVQIGKLLDPPAKPHSGVPTVAISPASSSSLSSASSNPPIANAPTP